MNSLLTVVDLARLVKAKDQPYVIAITNTIAEQIDITQQQEIELEIDINVNRGVENLGPLQQERIKDIVESILDINAYKVQRDPQTDLFTISWVV